MKNLFLSLAQAQMNTNCEQKVMFSARSLWSANSQIDMSLLTAEIRSVGALPQRKLGFTVEVNTPSKPLNKQRVPYLVNTTALTAQEDCVVLQVTALPTSL